MANNKFQDFIKKHSGGTTASSSFSPYQRPSARELYNSYARETDEEENKFQKFIKAHSGNAGGLAGQRQMMENSYRMNAAQANAERAARAELLPELERRKTGEVAPMSIQDAQARIADLDKSVQDMLKTYGENYYDGSDLKPTQRDIAASRTMGAKESNS